MKWPILLLLLGYVLWIYSRIGYISRSGTRVFLVTLAKSAAHILGFVFIASGILLWILL